MDVRFPSQLLIPLHRTAVLIGQGTTLALRPGEQLVAKVLAQSGPGRIVLGLGGRRVVAETQLSLPAGERLALQVVQTQPKVQLKVVASLSPVSIITSAVRRTLPHQVPLVQALSSFKTALVQPNLAPPVRSTLETLLTSLPERSALVQPDTLQAAIRQSGLFMEAARSLNGEEDLKSRLLKLAASIQTVREQTPAAASQAVISSNGLEQAPVPPAEAGSEPALLAELADKTSGALARLVLDQLASLPKSDGTVGADPGLSLTWQLEIPFRDGERLETLYLRIAGGKQTKGDPGEPSPWTADLEMNPPGLGRIRVKLVLQGKKISSYFWGETAILTRLLEHHLDTLARRFRAAGFEPNHLKAVGELKSGAGAEPAPSTVIAGPLLDATI